MWSAEKVNEVQRKAIKLAANDTSFRTELLQRPSEAIERLAGEPLPEGIKFRFIDYDPAYTATFVLPPLLTDEMSDEQLEKVAGGKGFSVYPVGLDGFGSAHDDGNEAIPNCFCCCKIVF